MATMTFYPDAHPETSSVDGYVDSPHYVAGSGVSWANLIINPGDSADDSAAAIYVADIKADNVLDQWRWLTRSIFVFNTATLPDDCTILSATFSIYGFTKSSATWNSRINIYSAAPAANNALVAGDFDSLGTTPYCDTPITYDAFDSDGYNNFVFNNAGIAAISKTGVTKLGIRDVDYDAGGTPPVWNNSDQSLFGCWSVDIGDYDYSPKLVITYSVPFIPKIFFI